MNMNAELLKRARAAGGELLEVERQALLCRAEYHTAIRRLHLGGASLREIAEALALSHQRVQQIVRAAGGSWWKSMWRTRTIRRDAVCTFCGRPPSEVAKLIAGPNVYICDACVALAEQARAVRGGRSKAARPSARATCSFCGKRSTEQRSLWLAEHAGVCSECLRLCREILDQRSA